MARVGSIGLVAVLALCGGCSKGDEGGGSSKASELCGTLESHAKGCNISLPGECDTSVKGEELCMLECLSKASCDELLDPNKEGTPVRDCSLGCQGVGADDFVCEDGTQYVSKAALCNGRFECQDGSDEAACDPSAGG